MGNKHSREKAREWKMLVSQFSARPEIATASSKNVTIPMDVIGLALELSKRQAMDTIAAYVIYYAYAEDVLSPTSKLQSLAWKSAKGTCDRVIDCKRSGIKRHAGNLPAPSAAGAVNPAPAPKAGAITDQTATLPAETLGLAGSGDFSTASTSDDSTAAPHTNTNTNTNTLPTGGSSMSLSPKVYDFAELCSELDSMGRARADWTITNEKARYKTVVIHNIGGEENSFYPSRIRYLMRFAEAADGDTGLHSKPIRLVLSFSSGTFDAWAQSFRSGHEGELDALSTIIDKDFVRVVDDYRTFLKSLEEGMVNHDS